MSQQRHQSLSFFEYNLTGLKEFCYQGTPNLYYLQLQTRLHNQVSYKQERFDCSGRF